MQTKDTQVVVYCPHTQVKCLLKALMFHTYKKNINISTDKILATLAT